MRSSSPRGSMSGSVSELMGATAWNLEAGRLHEATVDICGVKNSQNAADNREIQHPGQRAQRKTRCRRVLVWRALSQRSYLLLRHSIVVFERHGS